MADLLDDNEVDSSVEGSHWRRRGDRLTTTLERSDFAGAIELVNMIADLAEQANHHPDIQISWNKVTLELWTHSAGGITQADLDLASSIDSLELGAA
jgi:4a-hydroxytetrahydrobiopterin dehydratase